MVQAVKHCETVYEFKPKGVGIGGASMVIHPPFNATNEDLPLLVVLTRLT